MRYSLTRSPRFLPDTETQITKIKSNFCQTKLTTAFFFFFGLLYELAANMTELEHQIYKSFLPNGKTQHADEKELGWPIPWRTKDLN